MQIKRKDRHEGGSYVYNRFVGGVGCPKDWIGLFMSLGFVSFSALIQLVMFVLVFFWSVFSAEHTTALVPVW